MQYGVFGGFRFFLSLLLCSLLVVLPEVLIAASVSPGTDSAIAGSSLSADQKAAQVLSRLTFGARPGDFDRVKKMGVDAFINEQLNPDGIDDSALQKRLDRLPTLNLSEPTL